MAYRNTNCNNTYDAGIRINYFYTVYISAINILLFNSLHMYIITFSKCDISIY